MCQLISYFLRHSHHAYLEYSSDYQATQVEGWHRIDYVEDEYGDDSCTVKAVFGLSFPPTTFIIVPGACHWKS